MSFLILASDSLSTSKLVEARYKRKDLDNIKHNTNMKSIVIKELLMKSKTMVECRT